MTKLELEQCIEEYGTDIYSFCLHLTGNRQQADELYQETFLKAVEKRSEILSDGNVKSYLLSVAVRLWRNWRREDYNGVNALFSLPLDPDLAEPDAAQAYMESMEPGNADSAGEEAYRQGVREADAFMEKITPETIARYARRLEDSVEVFGAEEDGALYRYETAEGEDIMAYMDRTKEFPDGSPGMSPRIRYMHDESGTDSLRIITFTLNEDRTVTGAVWLPEL